MDTHCSQDLAMKDVGMRIRVEPELRKAFVETCHQENAKAAQVIREFMQAYVKQKSTAYMANKSTKLVDSIK